MKYNRWTVLEDGIRKSNSICCYCRCDCGNEKIVKKANLINGMSKSCGCLQKELLRENKRKKNVYTIDYENKIVIGKATNTQNEFYIDLEDFDKVKDLSWYETSKGYLNHKENGKVKQLHRIIANAPEGMVVDHINHNKRDNRKQNLRVCSHKSNARNRTNIPTGIAKSKTGNNYYYKVQLMGKYFGCSKDYEKAKQIRDKAIQEYYESWKWENPEMED